MPTSAPKPSCISGRWLALVTFGSLSILKHERFETQAFDLGNMDQAVWNTAQGRPFHFTNWEGGQTRLAAHVAALLREGAGRGECGCESQYR